MLFSVPWPLTTTHIESLTPPYTLMFHRFASDLITDSGEPADIREVHSKVASTLRLTSDVEEETGRRSCLSLRRGLFNLLPIMLHVLSTTLV
jgi:hypothetical protein